MFKFEHELIICQMRVNSWHLRYALLHPMAGATCFLFLKNIIGPIADYIPVLHPIGYPQAMVMDYRNLLGRGCTALYLTSPRHIYYLYVAKSLLEFMQNHIKNTEENIV